ncbi:MAG TPA: chaperonin GroEL [Candidatus Absconditabacterales bacterium]|nr:chaperonin GroEL [Candidatus Absconditabacterales bacterium]HRU50301.1 chaperonin GroEL [Candidatus Absconditabacterales bacterium]
MAKHIKYADEARKEIFSGMQMVADAVKVTMGPKGRNVILEKSYGGPTVTNDGVTVAKDIELEDKSENIGASMLKEAAEKTNKEAGDGTTTTVVLAEAMAREGLRYIRSGVNPFSLGKGLHRAIEKLVSEIKGKAQQIGDSKEKIKQVATVSAQDEEVGNLIADVFEEIGKDGTITVEEGQSLGLTKEIKTGMQFDQGYSSPYLITDTQRMEAVIEKPYILLTDKKISSIKDILQVLESIAATGKKDIVIIAEDIEGEALASLVLNKIRGMLNILTVKAPGFGDRKKEILQDIAVVTGATVITEELGLKLEDATIEMLGRADKVIATKDTTVIVDGKGDQSEIDERANQIKAQIGTTNSEYDREKLAERLAKLVGGVAVIQVGAATEMEMKNKKYKIEDALNATRAAIEEGIVAGGGSVLLQLSKTLEEFKLEDPDQQVAVDIVREAIQYPVKQIANNAGFKGDWVVEKIKESDDFNYGFDAKEGEFKNLFEAGIIDPAKVLRVALQNAVSTAAMFLTTECVIVDAPKPESCASCNQGGANAGMGGMGGMY